MEATEDRVGRAEDIEGEIEEVVAERDLRVVKQSALRAGEYRTRQDIHRPRLAFRLHHFLRRGQAHQYRATLCQKNPHQRVGGGHVMRDLITGKLLADALRQLEGIYGAVRLPAITRPGCEIVPGVENRLESLRHRSFPAVIVTHLDQRPQGSVLCEVHPFLPICTSLGSPRSSMAR